MEGNNLFVLLIQKDTADSGLVRQVLAKESSLKLQCVDSLATALARLGGGGVDLIVLDLALRDERATEGLTSFLQVREAAPQTPVVVLYDACDEGLALRAMRAGAADTVLKQPSGDGIALVIRSAAGRGRKPLKTHHANSDGRRCQGSPQHRCPLFRRAHSSC